MGALARGRIAFQILILALLGACAGGGGGGGGGIGGNVIAPPPSAMPRPPPVPLPPLPPLAAAGSFPATSSAEFLADWGPGGIHAEAAWQFQNAHGEGVLVGVIDDGVDPSHPELLGRIDIVNSVDIVGNRNQLTSALSHGSELSSLIAGNFNGVQTVGVAYEATILAVRADNSAGFFNDADLANAVNYAVSRNVRVINLSLGSASPTSAALRNAIQAATAVGVIIVVSAGNDGPAATQPNYPGFLATSAPVSNGLIMIAGGSNPDGSFNPNSNQAGSTATSYLVAPGWQIIVPDHGPVGPVPGFQTCGLGANGDLCRIQGTSYASPHVAGAAAVLMSAFPGLSPQQVVQILLQSTDDMGITGIDSQTGWGRLNLERAFQPIGSLSAPLAFGAFAIGPESMLGAVGAPFGDGMTKDPGPWLLSSFDSFGRTYNLNYANAWVSASAGPAPLAQAPRLWRAERSDQGALVQIALAEDVAPRSYRLPVDRAELEQTAMRIDAEIAAGLMVSFAAHGARTAEHETEGAPGHAALVNADTSLRLTRTLGRNFSLSFSSETGAARVGLSGEVSERNATAANLALEFDRAGFSLTAGRVGDQRGLLGLVWADALGETPAGEIKFAGFAGHLDPAPGWRLGFEAESGLAAFSQSGWLEVSEPLRTSAYAFEVSRAYSPPGLRPFGLQGGGAITLSLSQPLRVEAGALRFSAPAATNYGRQSLRYEMRTIEPIPTGRELRLGLGYRYFAGARVSAFAEALYVLEPGHVANAEPSAIARFGLRVAR